MTIAFPLLNVQPTGGTRVTLQHMAGLVAHGHEVIALLPTTASLEYHAMPAGVRVVRVPGTGGYARIVVALARALPACDIVFANSWQMVLPAMLARTIGHRATVVHLVQGFESFEGAGRSWLATMRNESMRRLALRLPTVKIAVSSWLRDRIQREYAREAHVVPNGVDTTVFRPNAPSALSAHFEVLTTARAARYKGFGDLADAVRTLRPTVPVRLLVASHEAVAIPDDIDGARLAPHDDRELARLYAGCDAFCFTSWTEGFGLPPLEAMACGAAVVTTACGGVDDFARDGENCLVVPPQRPDLLAAALRRLHDDPSLRATLGQAGIATAAAFTVQRSTERMAALLESLRPAQVPGAAPHQ